MISDQKIFHEHETSKIPSMVVSKKKETLPSKEIIFQKNSFDDKNLEILGKAHLKRMSSLETYSCRC